MSRLLSFIVLLSVVVSCTGYDDEDEWDCPVNSDCIEVLKCTPAIVFIRSKGEHPFKRCGWEGAVELVCCPSAKAESTTMSSTVSTTEAANVRSTSRPSEAACSTYASEAPLRLDLHILGGVSAARGEFPHMVALGYMRDTVAAIITWECAGSLISDRYVLTAAHCIARLRPVRLRLGILRLNDTGSNVQDHELDRVHVHPEYVRLTGTNDVALLQTTRPVEFNEMIHPACLYTQSSAPTIPLLITGWGRIESGTATRAVILQKALVDVFPIGPCNQTYIESLSRILTDGQICAGANSNLTKADTCQGDSGGPLQIFTKQNVYSIVGIVSFGLTDCGTDVPSVYARVYHYLDWIEKIVWP